MKNNAIKTKSEGGGAQCYILKRETDHKPQGIHARIFYKNNVALYLPKNNGN